jgi:hypothetical protein
MSNMDKLEQKFAQDAVLISEAADEFIEDKKLWFKVLHREHGGEIPQTAIEKGNNFLPNTALGGGGDYIPRVDEEPMEDEEKFLRA